MLVAGVPVTPEKHSLHPDLGRYALVVIDLTL